ncbi:MAG TPA: cation:proton antiporter [Candidatus Eisenbacteria bacterium]|nr:cation:proton antiporter [Candidatus Eisenbacteria bacterium]
MVAVLVFAVTLLLAVFLSEFARRSILSTAVLFLAAGFIAGEGMMDWIRLDTSNPVVSRFSELALFSVLFTDGMRIRVADLGSAWRLPGRALLFGLPLTVLVMALLARWTLGLTWIEACLLGAALSPTDPVFAAAIVGREEIPHRIRHLLNVESGVNDGIALPFVLVLLGLASGTQVSETMLLGEVALGILLGMAIPWTALQLEKTPLFSVASRYEPFDAFAIGLLVFAVASLTHANEFLAAFTAGVTIATTHPLAREQFHEFGDRLAELLKLAALLVFGALMSIQFLAEIDWTGYLFAFLALAVARPVALSVALAGSSITWREWLIAAWFGPRGFASVVFGLIILRSAIDAADRLFHLIAMVVAASIIAHSSTDVILSRWLYGERPEQARA